jgi:hypothetical protein
LLTLATFHAPMLELTEAAPESILYIVVTDATAHELKSPVKDDIEIELAKSRLAKSDTELTSQSGPIGP